MKKCSDFCNLVEIYFEYADRTVTWMNGDEIWQDLLNNEQNYFKKS